MRSLMAGAVALVVLVLTAAPVQAACPNDGMRVGASAALPDCRAYELVTPAYKASGTGVSLPSGDLVSIQQGIAARAGDRFVALGGTGLPLVDGDAALVFNYAFAERDVQAGWLSHGPLTHALAERRLARFPYVLAGSDDFQRVIFGSNGGGLSIFDELVESAGFGNPTFVTSWGGRWELLSPTAAGQLGTNPRALLSADGSRAVSPGLAWGLGGATAPDHPAWPDRQPESARGRSIHTADTTGQPADTFAGTGSRTLINVCTGADAARTVIPARDVDGKLAELACPAPEPGRDARLVSRHGAFMSGAVPNATPNDRVTNMVSRDGRRVFFVAPDVSMAATESGNPGAIDCTATTGADTSCPAQLYVWQEGADGRPPTVRWVSRAVAGLRGVQDASLTSRVEFEWATPDGDKVFFRTSSPLTADDPNGGGLPVPAGGVTTGTDSATSWDLYMYDFPDDPAADLGDGMLTRISRGPSGDADCNNPQGASSAFNPRGTRASTARFVSDDGSRVYFVCAAPIGAPGDAWNAGPAGGVAAPGGTPATTDQANLYLYDADRPPADRYRFVARLPRSTSSNLARCASTGHVDGDPTTARGFNDGAVNCVRGTPDGGFVTFHTNGALVAGDDAASGDIYGYDADAHELTRLSAPPAGVSAYPCAGGSVQCFAEPGFAHATGRPVPWGLLGVAVDPERPGDRIAFFQSAARLVDGDQNDVYDVYQWRDRGDGGELSLLSTGAAGAGDAIYSGADRDGRNVYLTTKDRLGWRDVDSVFDVYSARAGGGFAEPSPPALCDVLAGSCQGSPAGIPATVAPTGGPAGSGDARPRARVFIGVAPLSARARRRAARRGVLALGVRTSAPGRVRAVARARLGRRARGRARTVARGSVRARKAGRVSVRLRLRPVVRRRLRTGRALRLTVRITQPGARARATAVRLPGAGS